MSDLGVASVQIWASTLHGSMASPSETKTECGARSFRSEGDMVDVGGLRGRVNIYATIRENSTNDTGSTGYLGCCNDTHAPRVSSSREVPLVRRQDKTQMTCPADIPKSGSTMCCRLRRSSVG
jgi:hypothetical protein